MAHVHRLILAFVVLVLAGAAHAALTPVPAYMYGANSGGPWNGGPVASIEAGCSAYMAQATADSSFWRWEFHHYTASPPGWWCYGQSYRKSNGSADTIDQVGFVVQNGTTCPANSSSSQGSCSCNTGYQESNGACVAEPDECQKLAGQTAGYKNYEGKQDEFFFCDGWISAGGGKCVVKVERGLSWEDPPGSGHWLSQGKGIYTGQKASSCTGSGNNGDGPAGSTPKPPDAKAPDKPDPGTAAPAPCPAGQSAGDVNGQRVCAPRGPDGKVEEKSSGSGKNANGDTVKTDKETKCDGGQCTTTETKCTTPNGQTTSTCATTSSTGSSSTLCQPGSNLKICGDGDTQTGFSGSCAQGFRAVSDDAVTNAMAEEQYRRNCQFFEKTPDPNGDTQAYDAMRAKGMAGIDQTGDLPQASRVSMSISPGDIDSSNALGASACITDRTITVWNRSITLPLSDVCPWLGYLGTILMVVAYLIAARIVIR